RSRPVRPRARMDPRRPSPAPLLLSRPTRPRDGAMGGPSPHLWVPSPSFSRKTLRPRSRLLCSPTRPSRCFQRPPPAATNSFLALRPSRGVTLTRGTSLAADDESAADGTSLEPAHQVIDAIFMDASQSKKDWDTIL